MCLGLLLGLSSSCLRVSLGLRQGLGLRLSLGLSSRCLGLGLGLGLGLQLGLGLGLGLQLRLRLRPGCLCIRWRSDLASRIAGSGRGLRHGGRHNHFVRRVPLSNFLDGVVVIMPALVRVEVLIPVPRLGRGHISNPVTGSCGGTSGLTA